jgi:hypothetical protein
MNEDSNSENVHQQYVNAERGVHGFPDYFKERLEHDTNNELIQPAVFRELWYSDEPVHSLRSLESDFEAGRQTIGDRLDEMVEQGVLKKASMNNGDYWWINFPESDYPLPSDIVVHPRPEEEEDEGKMTVEEFFNQPHIQLGTIALLATAVGGLIILLGASQLSGNSTLPLSAESLLESGLISLYISYLVLISAVVAWVVSQALSSDEDSLEKIFRRN